MQPAEPIGAIADMHDDIHALALTVMRARPVALCTDVDGTIAPIAPTPEAARLLPAAPDLLQRAHETCAIVAVLSGRDLPSLWRLVHQPGLLYIGDHGNQWWQAEDAGELAPPDPQLAEPVAAMLADFATTPIAQTPGLRIEPKGATAAIHYRNTVHPETTRQSLLTELTRLAVGHAVRLTEGKAVIEIQALSAANKGDAIMRLASLYHLSGLVYLGDDRTDIDAFRAARVLRDSGQCQTFTIAIASPDAPPDLIAAADVALASIERVPEMLAWLLDLAQL